MDSNTPPSIKTLQELRDSGWIYRNIKAEMAHNAVQKLRDGKPIASGFIGYEDSVLPDLANALIAGHDIILLGERGQGKSRLVRSLVELLDEWMPIIEGTELNDNPYDPISPLGKKILESEGGNTPIAWVSNRDRYGEKLATPDTSVADLIGEVDPIKIAEGRYLSDELVLHYGLIPRTNRGIFAINELPDLAERIQVGLFNILEERDVQIRGFKIRLPLDIFLVASANPEDYTNRGRIVTPLKDRFGAQIRTHYPKDVPSEIKVVQQEASHIEGLGVKVTVPKFMLEIVAALSQLARLSPHVNQRSGVSVRLSITNYENLVANAIRRSIRLGEEEAVPRVSDLSALVSSTMGKVEIESFDEGGDEEIVNKLIKAATLAVFKEHVPSETFGSIVAAFENGAVIHVGDDLSSDSYKRAMELSPGLQEPVFKLADSESPGCIASAMELVLEGLHLSKRLNKDSIGNKSTYRARQENPNARIYRRDGLNDE